MRRAPSARPALPARLAALARIVRPAHPVLVLALVLAGSLLPCATGIAQERPDLFGGDFPVPDYVQSSGSDHRISRIAGILARVDHGGPPAVRGLEARDPGRPATPGSRGTGLRIVRNQVPVSGYHYMGELVRALQDDDFQNPGLFAVEHGAELWAAVEGTAGKSCASCHGEAARSMRGVAARYPAYDPKRGGLVNLELRINEERAEHMGAPALPMESEALLALTAFVTWQSRGMPMKVDISGEARRFFEDGKAFYERRRGQLDLACSQCHDRLAGARLRGDRISQGHVNGFPFYRLMWRSMGSRHRMFRWCNWAVRAETHELGSPEYLNLELYVAWRGRGLPIEAPAVRP